MEEAPALVMLVASLMFGELLVIVTTVPLGPAKDGRNNVSACCRLLPMVRPPVKNMGVVE